MNEFNTHRFAIILGFIFFLYLPLFFGFTTSTCTSYPVSLSSLTSCVGDTCLLEEHARVEIDAKNGRSSCVDFELPDGTNQTTTLTISVDSSYFHVKPDYCYWTDDVAVHSIGFCACPGGTQVSDTSCPVNNNYKDLVKIQSRVAKDDWCPLTAIFGTPGQHCWKHSFSAYDRYLVCHINPFENELLVDLNFELQDDLFDLVYQGKSTGYKFENISSVPHGVSVTIASDTVVPIQVSEFIVMDTVNPSDFWLLDSSHVNGKDEFNPNKIGWFKSNFTTKVSPDLFDKISVKLVNCEKNIFAFDYPWKSSKTLLSKLNDNKASNKIPEAIFVNQLLTSITDQKHDRITEFQDYQYLKDGIIYTNTWSPSFCGVTTDDFVFPTAGDAQAYTQVCAAGLKTFRRCIQAVCTASCQAVWNQFKTNNAGLVLGGNNVSDLTVKYLVVGMINAPSSSDCITNHWHPAVGFEFDQTAPYLIDNSGMIHELKGSSTGQKVWSWPSMRPLSVSYSNVTGFNKVLGQHNVDLPTELWVPPQKGTLNVDIVFKDVAIKFKDSLVYPKFDGCYQKGTSILYKAKSTMSPGECYISANNGHVITSQAVQLTNTFTDYEVSISTNYHDGPVDLLLTCLKGQVKCTLEVEIDVRTNETSFVEGTTGWDYALHVVNPLNWFNGIIQGLGGSKWNLWDILSLVFWCCVALLCGGVIIIIVVKIYRCVRKPKTTLKYAKVKPLR